MHRSNRSTPHSVRCPDVHPHILSVKFERQQTDCQIHRLPEQQVLFLSTQLTPQYGVHGDYLTLPYLILPSEPSPSETVTLHLISPNTFVRFWLIILRRSRTTSTSFLIYLFLPSQHGPSHRVPIDIGPVRSYWPKPWDESTFNYSATSQVAQYSTLLLFPPHAHTAVIYSPSFNVLRSGCLIRPPTLHSLNLTACLEHVLRP